MQSTRMVTGAILGTVLLTLFAGPIGAAIGAAGMPGLVGIAAVNHGLAMLGGGALAAGGFGMAGGTGVLMVSGAAIGAYSSGKVEDVDCLKLALSSVPISYQDIYRYQSGASWYEGGIVKQIPSGEGHLYDRSGRLLFSGTFVDGLPRICN